MALLPLKDDNPVVYIRFQYVTVAIMIASVLVFLFQLTLSAPAEYRFVYDFGLIPAALVGQDGGVRPGEVPAAYTLVTHLFLHADFFHLAGNMLFLWVFGDNIEDELGHARFVLFYLFCGLIAVLTHSVVTSDPLIPVVGASGAISGILAAYLILHPRARILVIAYIPIPLRLPTYIVLGFWIVLNLINGITEFGAEQGVAWWAHIGGFAAGVIGLQVFGRRGSKSRRDRARPRARSGRSRRR